MPEVVYYVAASLDGFIATPDGGLSWLAPFESSPVDYGYADFYSSVDEVLLGSRTYEQALTFGEWPYAGRPATVFSRRALPAGPGVTVTDRTPRDVVTGLGRAGSKRAWLVGGGALASAFEREGLITEYVVSVMPVVLGSGVGMLGGAGTERRLRLEESTRYPDGVVQLRYRTE